MYNMSTRNGKRKRCLMIIKFQPQNICEIVKQKVAHPAHYRLHCTYCNKENHHVPLLFALPVTSGEDLCENMQIRWRCIMKTVSLVVIVLCGLSAEWQNKKKVHWEIKNQTMTRVKHAFVLRTAVRHERNGKETIFGNHISLFWGMGWSKLCE